MLLPVVSYPEFKYNMFMSECIVCGKEKSRQAEKYCSFRCYWGNMKGKPTKNIKGLELGRGWNKGIKGEKSHAFENDWGFQKIDHDSLYKLDKLAYLRQHKRWYRKAGKATVCELCGTTKNTQWHNKSGKYVLVISDWMQVCAKCHWIVDKRRAGK